MPSVDTAHARPMAQRAYDATRGLVAFHLSADARFQGANQYGRRYRFPDGSTLRIDGARNRIEWRASGPGSPGAVRTLYVQRVDVLCGCGWGRLAVPLDDIPERCPLCSRPIGSEGF